MPDNDNIKARLRGELRDRRRSLAPDQQALAARSLTATVTRLPAWQGARTLALYLAADGEIDTLPLAGLARRERKSLYLPVIQPDDSLRFARWEQDSTLQPNRFDIPEPPAGTPLGSAAEMDIIFLPLVGWNRHGVRLGMGGGFYDRTLAGVSGPLLVGLAHDEQETDVLPRDEWDIALDAVATGTALHICGD
jgi:5-formyltetrahydrofolate cyclo-ligase